jgi:hypothetical protein
MFPGPKPGARHETVTPLMELGCGGNIALVEAGVIGAEDDEAVREFDAPSMSALLRLSLPLPCGSCVSPSLARGMLMSSSGNVMKNRHPNVVPKKAPSTV